MKNSKFNLSIFLEKKPEVTDKVVEHYRKNPEELDLIIDREQFHVSFLTFFFVLGILITLTTRILKFFFQDSFGKFVNDVILDVGSELGIAIFGGAITAYYLGFLEKKQYRRNMDYRNEIKRRLNTEK